VRQGARIPVTHAHDVSHLEGLPGRTAVKPPDFVGPWVHVADVGPARAGLLPGHARSRGTDGRDLRHVVSADLPRLTRAVSDRPRSKDPGDVVPSDMVQAVTAAMGFADTLAISTREPVKARRQPSCGKSRRPASGSEGANAAGPDPGPAHIVVCRSPRSSSTAGDLRAPSDAVVLAAAAPGVVWLASRSVLR